MSVFLLQCCDASEVNVGHIELRLEVIWAFRGVLKPHGRLFARFEHFVHLVERKAEHQHVEEYDFCEVINAFVESSLRWDLSHLTKTFLLDNNAIESDFEPVAYLTESFEEHEAKGRGLSRLCLKHTYERVVDWTQSVANEGQGSFSNRHRHIYSSSSFS